VSELTQTPDHTQPAPQDDAAPRPTLITGALVGAMLTAPLIVLFLLGSVLLDLAFVPLDLFDWMARVLPGDIVVFGVNAIVEVIDQFDLGPTDSTAKLLQQLQGVAMVFGIGVVIGAVVFKVLNNFDRRAIYPVAVGVGVLTGLFFTAINLEFSISYTSSDISRIAEIMILFTLWGAGFAWIYSDLTAINKESTDGSASVVQVNRRQFLIQLGGATATLTVGGTAITALVNLMQERDTATGDGFEEAALPQGLPNRSADVVPVQGTRPEYTPLDDHYRIDISSRPPVINGDTYRLQIGGMVEEPVEISLSDLETNYEPVDQYVTLSCISNRIAGDLISTTKWTGVPMHILLDEWGVDPDARYLHIRSADGFDEYVSIDLIRQDERVMLAYAWDDLPLKQKHGFPLRIFIPDLYGMKQPKWITEIDAVEEEGEGYWVRRSWDAVADVNPVSVVDTVSTMTAYDQDGTLMIPIGGIAYSGAKGISRVEVSIDDGEWVEAQTREPLSETTWVLWRYDWPFQSGSHTFAVRAYTADGELQPTDRQGTFPSGATGVHEVARRIPDDVEPAPEATPEATPELPNA
jgi:DMSO/TMAO reductase YedYZ molybdopterin-dependent catalytic subunit